MGITINSGGNMCTVKELIEKLKEYPEDTIVHVVECSIFSVHGANVAAWKELDFDDHVEYMDWTENRFESKKSLGKILYLGYY